MTEKEIRDNLARNIKTFRTIQHISQAELAEQNKSSERKNDAKEVDALYKEAVAANRKYHEAVKKFCEKWGSYHTTLTGNDISDTLLDDFLLFF